MLRTFAAPLALLAMAVGAMAQPSPKPALIKPVPAQDMVTLQYPNADVGDVLRLYETLTNKHIVMDNFVQGKVSIFLSKPVPKDEAIEIIKMNLLMNGFSLVPVPPDIVKVIGTGKNPRTAGIPIISDEADIPAGEEVISYLFKLRYADPVELQQVLLQYLSPPQSYTSALPLPKSSAILITENSSVIRELTRIVNQVDVPPAEVVSEFIKLERADASKVVEMLKDVFDKGTQPQQANGVPGAPNLNRGVRPLRNNIPGQPMPAEEPASDVLTALSEDNIVVGKIKIAADVRTNRIHVITRPVNMPFVRKLIAEFDANVQFAKPVTRPLRYISASDVLPVLVQALTEPGTNGEGGANANLPGAAPTPLQQTRPNSGINNGYGSTGSSGAGGALNISEELQTQAVDTSPKAVTVGNAKIIADPRANSIIVLGNREVVVKVQKILDELDIKAPQVALSTVIGELSINNDKEFGIDYFARGSPHLAGTTNFTGVPPFAGGAGTTSVTTGSPPVTTKTTTGVGNIFDPGNLISFTQLATAAASGANVYLAAGNSLAAVVHALESTGRFKTISRPTVVTSNNKKAIIASGQEVPVPVNTLSNAQAVGTGVAAVSSSIEYKQVTLQLEVVPLINSEKEVSLDILQKIDSLVQGGSVNIGGNTVPTIATRYVRSNVSAPNGATIVLGGLIQAMDQNTKTGLPLLSRIPVIGSLFRSTTRNKSRSELIILLRPEVALTPLDLFRLRQKHEERTHFGPEIDQDDCPDCPPPVASDKQLPAPDVPVNGKDGQ
ncbi:MAG: hypothetical protein M3R59_02295 [Verrucomicrobiota bacterium]|nr:hypothetical protein [Verrucomicrobiota bacterium]